MKKLTALLLCLVLAVSFAACSTSNDDKQDENQDTPVTLADGTYTKEATEEANGFKDTLTLTVEGGKITSVVWDGVASDGTTKRDAVAQGNYEMPGELSWSEQADALSAEVVENQGTANLNPTDGKVDTVAGVTMNVSWFVQSVNELIAEASK